MSDEDRPPCEERSTKAEAMFIHYCMHEGCKKWGSHGFAGWYGVEGVINESATMASQAHDQ